jgi:hypothetical protein
MTHLNDAGKAICAIVKDELKSRMAKIKNILCECINKSNTLIIQMMISPKKNYPKNDVKNY